MKKKIIGGMISLVAVAVIGMTIAYFNQNMSVDNKLATKADGAEMVEKFKPDMDWQPGAEVNKDVWVKNTGAHELVARVKMEEKWFDDADYIKEYTGGTGSVVTKTLFPATESKWLNDGDWYYYDGVIGKDRVQFLDSITLSEGALSYTTKYYYTTAGAEPAAEAGWTSADSEADIPAAATFKKSVSVPAEGSYAGKYYQLTITTQVLSAAKDAVDAEQWGGFKTVCPDTYSKLPQTEAKLVQR